MLHLDSKLHPWIWCALVGAGCSTSTPTSAPQAYRDADVHEGGRLYDRVWPETPPDNFTGDHPLWESRVNREDNSSRGSETWRCQECHGWDYLGVEGQYGQGAHNTGFAGILNTALSPDSMFELLVAEPVDLEGGHAYGRFLEDREIWDLVKFSIEGTVSTNDIIDASGTFVSGGKVGEELFMNGIGREPSCASCHAADGREMPHVDDGHEDDDGDGAEDEDEHEQTVGSVARDNPWEFHHKARFGHPGSPMHGMQRGGATHEQIGALGAFAQSLP